MDWSCGLGFFLFLGVYSTLYRYPLFPTCSLCYLLVSLSLFIIRDKRRIFALGILLMPHR
jgi:hypothetical protein